MLKTNQSEQLLHEVDQYIGTAQYAGLYGIALNQAYGNTLVDVDGNEYTDFLSAASAVALGYSRDDLINTYADTAKKIVHSCFVYSPNQETVDLAKKLTEISPGNFKKKVLFGLSGSDSVDGAIKAARKFTGKMGVVAFNNAYHGNTGLSAQATGFPGIRNGFLESGEFHFIDFPVTEEEVSVCLSKLEDLYQNRGIACIIVEPIQGDGGNLVPPSDFFSKLQGLSHKHDVLLIDDETQCGVGRSGKWWAIEHFGISPDLLVTAKALGSGYVSISACIGKAEIIDCLNKAQHVFTYSGHPPSSAVASKVISIIEQEDILSQVKDKGEMLISELNKLKEKHPHTQTEVRGIGLQIGLAIKNEEHQSVAALFGARCLEKGIYVGYFGSANDVLRIHPPLTITKKEIITFIQVLDQVFDEWEQNTIPASAWDRYHTHCLGLGKNQDR